MKFKAIVAAAALILMQGPAIAGWYYTQWGMTPEQLIAHGGAHSQPSTANTATQHGELKAVGEWIYDDPNSPIGTFSFPVNFYFDANGLSQVTIFRPTNPRFECTMMIDFMEKKYGKPYEMKVVARIFGSVSWRVPNENNHINVWVGPDHGHRNDCYMTFLPLTA